jgi:phosphate transport system protein
MPARLAFHEGLRLLEDNLVGMADVVGGAIEKAVRALTDRDPELAHEVVGGDEKINNRYARIERETLELIATQQPMATDLREILAISAIATDLERIGDYAKGIATVTLRVLDEPPLKPLVDIPRMADIVRELLAAEVGAFVKSDPNEARRVAERDDEVDALYDQIYRELVTYMMDDPRTINRASRLLWVAKSLERIGDHVTNIGERVVFVTTGELVELND